MITYVKCITLFSQSKFKTKMLKLSLSDFGDAYILVLKLSLSHYNDAYLLVKGTKTVANTGKVTVPNNRNVRVIAENCAPITDYISETNNTQEDQAKDVDVVMHMYNFI